MSRLFLSVCLCILFSATSVHATSPPQKTNNPKVLQNESEQELLLNKIKAMQREVEASLRIVADKSGKEFLDKARTVLQHSQWSVESKQNTSAARMVKLSEILIKRAKNVTLEQEANEKNVIKRAELKKLEVRVEDLLKGKDK